MQEQTLKKLKWIFWIATILALVATAITFNLQGLLKQSLEWIAGLGALAPVLFIVIYILATILFIPGTVLTLGAGVLFGVVKGSIFVSVASTLGATFAFLIGRTFARGWISKKIEEHEKFKAVDHAVAKEGWKIVGLTRLSPLFPFNFLNYAFGVTQVTLKDYFFASWIGMMPGTVMYVYVGYLAGDLANLTHSSRGVRTPLERTLYIIGLIATVAVTLYVTRIAKKALAKKVSI